MKGRTVLLQNLILALTKSISRNPRCDCTQWPKYGISNASCFQNSTKRQKQPRTNKIQKHDGEKHAIYFFCPRVMYETLQKHDTYSQVLLNIKNSFFFFFSFVVFCFVLFLLNHILSHLPSFSSCSSAEKPFMLVQLPVSGQQ